MIYEEMGMAMKGVKGKRIYIKMKRPECEDDCKTIDDCHKCASSINTFLHDHCFNIDKWKNSGCVIDTSAAVVAYATTIEMSKDDYDTLCNHPEQLDEILKRAAVAE